MQEEGRPVIVTTLDPHSNILMNKKEVLITRNYIVKDGSYFHSFQLLVCKVVVQRFAQRHSRECSHRESRKMHKHEHTYKNQDENVVNRKPKAILCSW